MPITKSAKKSLKVSRVKASKNRENEVKLEKALRSAKKENVNSVISLIDKAVKTGLIHKNKAARMKSKLTKKLGTPKAEVKKPTASKTTKKVSTSKKPVKKTALKKSAKK